ncbi:MAG: DUF4019 domain-containing protein [Pseudomonadota bacterium]
MAEAIDDLTDKEKEALRLLLAGHDAKSAALELDISVHTLNDRLRAARRKLGVTTSKEAARALGLAEQSELEPTPESFVHKPLGVQETSKNQHLSSVADRSEGGILAFAARRKGLLIMSFAIALALTATVFIPKQAGDLEPPTQDLSAAQQSDVRFSAETEFVPARPTEPELQARRWLGLIDFGKFDESYEEAGEPLRQQYALGKWKFGLTLRMTKGKIQDRTVSTIMRTSEFGGRKGGDFEIITFASMFENNNLQSERVVLELVGSDWQVIDYEILPGKDRLD